MASTSNEYEGASVYVLALTMARGHVGSRPSYPCQGRGAWRVLPVFFESGVHLERPRRSECLVVYGMNLKVPPLAGSPEQITSSLNQHELSSRIGVTASPSDAAGRSIRRSFVVEIRPGTN